MLFQKCHATAKPTSAVAAKTTPLKTTRAKRSQRFTVPMPVEPTRCRTSCPRARRRRVGKVAASEEAGRGEASGGGGAGRQRRRRGGTCAHWPCPPAPPPAS